jgi:hypothetical protein
VKISFEKAFTNNFITTLLGISPREIGENTFFTLGLGPIFDPIGPKKNSRKISARILTPFSELLPNLYYSPIKKLENIFIFKIARQQRP